MSEGRERMCLVLVDFDGRKLRSGTSGDEFIIFDAKGKSEMILSCPGHASSAFMNIIIKIYRSSLHSECNER